MSINEKQAGTPETAAKLTPAAIDKISKLIPRLRQQIEDARITMNALEGFLNSLTKEQK